MSTERFSGGLAELETALGTTYGPAAPVPVTQQMIDLFADATGDHQWIHVDRERAAAGPFGTTIAHGYLTLSLVPRFLAELIEVTGVGMGVNYGVNKVRFPAPVPSGSSLTATVAVALVERAETRTRVTFDVVIRADAGDAPVCVAQVVVLYVA
jgi:acyl dehydratase